MNLFGWYTGRLPIDSVLLENSDGWYNRCDGIRCKNKVVNQKQVLTAAYMGVVGKWGKKKTSSYDPDGCQS
jgi:hypothetical protein